MDISHFDLLKVLGTGGKYHNFKFLMFTRVKNVEISVACAFRVLDNNVYDLCSYRLSPQFPGTWVFFCYQSLRVHS